MNPFLSLCAILLLVAAVFIAGTLDCAMAEAYYGSEDYCPAPAVNVAHVSADVLVPVPVLR